MIASKIDCVARTLTGKYLAWLIKFITVRYYFPRHTVHISIISHSPLLDTPVVATAVDQLNVSTLAGSMCTLFIPSFDQCPLFWNMAIFTINLAHVKKHMSAMPPGHVLVYYLYHEVISCYYLYQVIHRLFQSYVRMHVVYSGCMLFTIVCLWILFMGYL